MIANDGPKNDCFDAHTEIEMFALSQTFGASLDKNICVPMIRHDTTWVFVCKAIEEKKCKKKQNRWNSYSCAIEIDKHSSYLHITLFQKQKFLDEILTSLFSSFV